jgi:predicted transcriptional regulator
MAKDPFLLVSLEESESKALAQVISNDSARKILDLLSKENSSTESDIAKSLKAPLSTIHYNLQALVKANLVQAEEFHYSEKGKEVLHYSLANKLIIIAPKKLSAESFRDKLKSLLPVGLIALATAGVIQLVSMFRSGLSFGANLGGEKASEAAIMTQKVAGGAAADNAPRLMAAIAPEAASAPGPAAVAASSQPAIAFWFFLGVVFTLLLLAIWYFFATRKKEKK